MKRRAVIAMSGAALLAAILAVSGEAKTSTSRVTTKADPTGKFRYHPNKLSAKAGTVTIVMVNPKGAGQRHGIAVQGKGINKKGPIVRAGHTATLTVTLKAGTYTFYCNFDGHRRLGMVGTLTVK